jgi:hypothetical protein
MAASFWRESDNYALLSRNGRGRAGHSSSVGPPARQFGAGADEPNESGSFALAPRCAASGAAFRFGMNSTNDVLSS